MLHWSLTSTPKVRLLTLREGTMERPWDSQISVVPQPPEQSSPCPGASSSPQPPLWIKLAFASDFRIKCRNQV